MKKLSDLFGEATTDLQQLWDSTPTESEPLPSGTYEMEALKGELFESQNGTPGYKITWAVTGGEHDGRRVWQDLWLTQRAMKRTKRLLQKLHLTVSDMESPLPEGLSARVLVALRQRDDDSKFNEVKDFGDVWIEAEPFAPAPSADPEPKAATSTATEWKTQTPSPPPKQDGAIEVPPHVWEVAEEIPAGEPITIAELLQQLKMTGTEVQDALQRLKQYGLKQKQVAGTYVYSWKAKPHLSPAKGAPEAVTIEDTEFLEQLQKGEN